MKIDYNLSDDETSNYLSNNFDRNMKTGALAGGLVGILGIAALSVSQELDGGLYSLGIGVFFPLSLTTIGALGGVVKSLLYAESYMRERKIHQDEQYDSGLAEVRSAKTQSQ
ncbi:hypothetical protein HN747_00960 [archaeon]|nr:hypothetical protein [archaeon]